MKRAIFNLSIDDVHPESSTHGTDCGGDREQGAFRYIFQILKRYPQVKITLFVTADWIYRATPHTFWNLMKRALKIDRGRCWEDHPFRLDKHKDWCSWVSSQPNMEIAFHGLHHYRSKFPYSAEFKGLSYSECLRRLSESEKIFRDAGMRYVKGFRPPGWGISDGIFEACRALDFKFIACSADSSTEISKHALSRGAGIHGVSLIYPSRYRGLINIPQNWDIMNSDPKRGVEIAKLKGVIGAKGHIANVYDGELIGNGLNEQSLENLMDLLEQLENYEVEFMHMSQIAELVEHA